MSRDSGVYVHPDVDAEMHGDYVLGLMGCYAPQFCDFIARPICDDNPPLKKYIFMRPPKNCGGRIFKYVIHKSGIKKFLPVTCSENCPKCGGCSPGCGRNIEFDEIKADFNPSPEIWRSLRSPPSETHRYEDCIILYF